MEITAADGKGDNAKSVTCTKPLGETLDESVELFGEDVVHKNFLANVVVSIQGIERTGLRGGKTKAEIQKAIDEYSPGVRQKGKSRVEKLKEELRGMDTNARKALLAEVAKEAQGAA